MVNHTATRTNIDDYYNQSYNKKPFSRYNRYKNITFNPLNGCPINLKKAKSKKYEVKI